MTQARHHWLVIEDDPVLQEGLEAHYKSSARQMAKNAQDARALLLSYPYRCISFDLALPRSGHEPLVETTVGLNLRSHELPLARKIVYTGYRQMQDGLIALVQSGQGGFVVLEKAAFSEAQGQTGYADPLVWCALQLHLLGHELPQKWDPQLRDEAQKFISDLENVQPLALEPWLKAYWRLAAEHLPQPLAEAAARYVQDRPPDKGSQAGLLKREAVLALNDFREWALWLAAAQSAVLLRAGAQGFEHMHTAKGITGITITVQNWLKHQLPALLGLSANVPGALAWQHYMGLQAASASVSLPSSLALNAFDELRQVRNEVVHGLKPQPIAQEKIKGLENIMDLASFWANNPLVTQVRREHGCWRAKALRGPYADGVLLKLPDDVQWPSPQGPEPDRVYQWLWCFDTDDGTSAASDSTGQEPRSVRARAVMVDWWPYLRWVYRRESSTNELVLLTYPHVQRERFWHGRSLSGQDILVQVTEQEASALTRAPHAKP